MLDEVGEVLDPEAGRLLREIEELGMASLTEQAPTTARETFRAVKNFLQGPRSEAEAADGISARDAVVHGAAAIPVRVFAPHRLTDAPCHVVTFMHGGGWVVGDLDTHAHTARAIADALQARVVAVDYRKAPEFPYPAAFEDCLAVAEAMSADDLTLSLSVAGDSAGGNLAAAVALACREPGRPKLAAQLLVYPALSPKRSGGSVERFAVGFGLTKRAMEYYDRQYLSLGSDTYPEYAAPLLAEDLSGLLPTVVATAGADVLLDEGRAYARRLVEHDVPTAYLPSPTLPHGWMDMVPKVQAATVARLRALSTFRAIVNPHE